MLFLLLLGGCTKGSVLVRLSRPVLLLQLLLLLKLIMVVLLLPLKLLLLLACWLTSSSGSRHFSRGLWQGCCGSS